MNDNIIRICDADLGSEVLLTGPNNNRHNPPKPYNGLNPLSAHYIASSKPRDLCCIGWEEYPICANWNMHRHGLAIPVYTESIRDMVQDIKKFKFGYWIDANWQVALVTSSVLFPDQTCIDCGVSSPHIKPNINDKFLCASCNVIRELIQ